MATAIVEFSGMQQRIQMACVTEAEIGDYVVVHAGIAIARIDPAEAEKTLNDLRSLAKFGEESH